MDSDNQKKKEKLIKSIEEQDFSGQTSSSKSTTKESKIPSGGNKQKKSSTSNPEIIFVSIVVSLFIFVLIVSNVSKSDYNSYTNSSTSSSYTTIIDSIRTELNLQQSIQLFEPIFGVNWKDSVDSFQAVKRDYNKKIILKNTFYDFKDSYREKNNNLTIEFDDKIVNNSYSKEEESIKVEKIDFFDKTTRVSFVMTIFWEDGRKILGVKSGYVKGTSKSYKTGVEFPLRFPPYTGKQFDAIILFQEDCELKSGRGFGYNLEHTSENYNAIKNLNRYDYRKLKDMADKYSSDKKEERFWCFWCKFEFSVEVPIYETKIVFLGVDNKDNHITYDFKDEIDKIVKYWDENEPYMHKNELAKKPSIAKTFN